jgi:hypothetical protein
MREFSLFVTKIAALLARSILRWQGNELYISPSKNRANSDSVEQSTDRVICFPNCAFAFSWVSTAVLLRCCLLPSSKGAWHSHSPLFHEQSSSICSIRPSGLLPIPTILQIMQDYIAHVCTISLHPLISRRWEKCELIRTRRTSGGSWVREKSRWMRHDSSASNWGPRPTAADCLRNGEAIGRVSRKCVPGRAEWMILFFVELTSHRAQVERGSVHSIEPPLFERKPPLRRQYGRFIARISSRNRYFIAGESA